MSQVSISDDSSDLNEFFQNEVSASDPGDTQSIFTPLSGSQGIVPPSREPSQRTAKRIYH
jgi:hypothetical protein